MMTRGAVRGSDKIVGPHLEQVPEPSTVTTHHALILIGFQNDYFGPGGVLRSVMENEDRNDRVVSRTVALVRSIVDSKITILGAPIVFTDDYKELRQADGILAAIKASGALRDGQEGTKTIAELLDFGDRIIEVPGKRGLNAFSNTTLARELISRDITDVAIAGASTSIWIDSTGRTAYEMGFKVSMLADCISARTDMEHDIFCSKVFPTYATVMNSEAYLQHVNLPADN